MKYKSIWPDFTIKTVICSAIIVQTKSLKLKKAYAVTGAIATAAAAAIEGSTVHEAVGGNERTGWQEVRIGHPSGVMCCEVESRLSAGGYDIPRARIRRTARRVSQGTVFVPNP